MAAMKRTVVSVGSSRAATPRSFQPPTASRLAPLTLLLSDSLAQAFSVVTQILFFTSFVWCKCVNAQLPFIRDSSEATTGRWAYFVFSSDGSSANTGVISTLANKESEA